MLNEAVQTHPAEAMDPEIAGQLAAIGIVKGQPFNPDARMKKILTEAAAVANAAGRAMRSILAPLKVLDITAPIQGGRIHCSPAAMTS